MKLLTKSTLVVVFVFWVATFLPLVQQVAAHRPATTKASCDGDYGSSTTALPLADPTISWSFKHYLDCTHRAVWIQFDNETPNQRFYVGVGIPPQDRFAPIRADALIIGPGLPQLTTEEWDQVPQEVRDDPVWDTPGVGAYFHASPEDQSTCDHLGNVMQGSTTVLDGRCDFYEPFGRTHSWRVLDADDNILPQGNGATYHVAVFLQEDTSAKVGIALGTWVENFITRYNIDTPTCSREIDDFSEKGGVQDECFPVVSCPAAQRPIGCEDAFDVAAPPVCELGEVCEEGTEAECVTAGMKYEAPTMGACGGELCPAAVHTWEAINAKMHVGMMDLEYTGDADIDFVRGMISHHFGAVDMCEGLLQNLTCTVVEDVDNLEGLVHFCNHVKLEQEIEVGGMRRWLESKNISEMATCHSEAMMMDKNGHNDMGHGMGMDSAMKMQESCGNTTALSSEKLIDVNHKMHDLMAVKYSCDHSLDFVRMMLPHHAGAVDMCDILMETTEDTYLIELCDNITHTQRAEIAWMSQWLESREMPATGPCDCSLEEVTFSPCEDMLSTSSFCHGIAGKSQDGYCRCDEVTFNASGYSCDGPTWVDGFGLFVPENLCQRSCGKCPTSERPVWVPSCGKGHGHGHHSMAHGSHGGMGHDSHDVVRSGNPSKYNSGANQTNQLLIALAVACMTVIKLML